MCEVVGFPNIILKAWICIFALLLASELAESTPSTTAHMMHDDTPTNNSQKVNRTTIKVPKCCAQTKILTENGCEESKESKKFDLRLNFLEMNETHINNESRNYSDAFYKPYENKIKCENERIALDPNSDRMDMLQNGSLLYYNHSILFSPDKYCIDVLHYNGSFETLPLICVSGSNYMPQYLYHAYTIVIFTSSVFFLLTAMIFLNCQTIRGRCVTIYSFFMACSFMCLGLGQVLHAKDKTCNEIGYILEFFLLMSFSWLAFLSYETYCTIIKIEIDVPYIEQATPIRDETDGIRYTQRVSAHRELLKFIRNKLTIYAVISLLISVIILGCSDIIVNTPFLPVFFLKPQLGGNQCLFEESTYKIIYLYIPTYLALASSVVFLVKSFLHIKELKRRGQWSDENDAFSSCLFVVIIAFICWTTQAISFAINTYNGIVIAIDILDSLQGVIVFIVFVCYNKGRFTRWKRKCTRPRLPEEVAQFLKRFDKNSTS